MKKILIFLAVLEVAVISTLLIIRNNETDVEFISESFSEHSLYKDVQPTFKFTASSKHFTLATGEAYYIEKEYDNPLIVIDNLKLVKEIKNLKSYSLNVRFYEILLYNNEMHYQGKEYIKDFLANTKIISSGNYYGQFYLSKENEFKDNLKISIKYCLYNNKCYEEKLKIKYID